LFFGIESGSQEVLEKSINKRSNGSFLKVQDIKDTVISCKKAGIYTVGSMVVPSPFDNEKTLKESLDLLLSIRPDSVPVNIPGVLPRTPWAEDPERFGIVLGDNYFNDMMFYSPTLLLPPKMWKPMRYSIGGKSFEQIASESNSFAERLESEGILTQVADETALMANLSGMPPRELRDMARDYLSSGNYEGISGLVQRINDNALNKKA
jgi:radical SAM superfamily enzyme YgiQ (UPF0313 family)